MSKILVFDNYDSFTYNLVQLLENITGETVDVFRNDKIALDEVEKYDKILLSPGPGIPEEAGLLLPLIQRFAPTKSILGVCLGEQAIAQAFGANLINLPHVFHGIKTSAHKTAVDSPLFAGLPTSFEVGRYHSWAVDSTALPDCLEVTALDDDNMIMALQHKTYDVQGVQFHPESILTPQGELMIRNWLKKG